MTKEVKRIRVVFFFRKPFDFHYSIENLFNSIFPYFSENIEVVVKELPFYSKGFFPRLGNCIYACLNQGDINHNTGDVYYISIFTKKRKTVTTFHDFTFLKNANGVSYSILKLFWVKLPFMRSGTTTVISQKTGDELAALVKLKSANTSKIHLIPNIISPVFQRIEREFNSNKPNILHIGTTPNKNIERLIEALDGVNCQLTLIGKLSSEHLALLSIHKIDYKNHFRISELELIECYRQCDILSFCSLNEGFGLPILEAQSVGRAILTSNISSMPEVAGKGALLINPYSVEMIKWGINELLENSALREELIEYGYMNVQRYQPKTVALQYEKVYQTINN